MLLHIVPRLYTAEPHCDLIDFHCPALGLKLRNGIELVARRPYPNKRYMVACRKVGQKAVNGFMVETTERLREFTAITRWAVGGERVVNHQVQYFVLDDEFDAVSEDMGLWFATCEGLGSWSDRWPEVAKNWTPAAAQPRMELVSKERDGHYADRHDEFGQIVERSEVFQMRTIERERIEQRASLILSDRIPAVSTAFRAAI